LSQVTKEYLACILNSRSTQNQIEEFITSSGQPILALFRIETIKLPLAPIEEQDEIARRVNALFKLAEAIEKRVAATLLRADRLTQAILAKAFRGELVLTEAELARREGRKYETAQVLLERIRQKRSALPRKQTSPKRKWNSAEASAR